MKTFLFGLALAAACSSSPGDTAQPLGATPGGAVGYHVLILSTLGGNSGGNSINDQDLIAGTSDLADGVTTHASIWSVGLQKDLGTLGGPNSGVIWPVKNTLGVISGIAERPELDPLGELWSCFAFFDSVTGHVCRGFVWEGGHMRELPTLGGNNGFATGTNNLRQTVGWAENAVHDPTCNLPQQLQFRAAIWGPDGNVMQELPPLPDDTTTAATAINDGGQVVGISGICSNAIGGFSARKAVMWENGVVRDLGDLGGVAWNTPMALNENGDAVGFANLPGTVPAGRFNEQAVYWPAGGTIQLLGTVGTDPKSQALGINDARQIVGLSCGGGTCRAFIYENGAMTDLNQLVISGAKAHLFAAGDINDSGVITGQTLDDDGTRSTFLAFPTPLPH